MARGTEYITLAVSRGGMGYCCPSLWERANPVRHTLCCQGSSGFPPPRRGKGPRGPCADAVAPRARAGVQTGGAPRLCSSPPSQPSPARGEGAQYQGEMFMSTHTRSLCLGAWFICALLVCMASTTAWSDSDKTIVDLQRGRPEAPSRYHRPRAAHLYQYDKTEVDLAVPLPQQPAEEQRDSQRPATLPAPMPAPTTPPPQTPLPGGGR